MPKVTADEMAEKWARRLKGATEDIRRGVDKVSEAPSKKAVAKQDKMKANLISAIESGKWAKELGKVTLEEYKSAMKDIGVGRIPAGVDKEADDFKDFASQLLPHVAAGQATIAKMPDVTLEDSVARASTWIRHMAKFERK